MLSTDICSGMSSEIAAKVIAVIEQAGQPVTVDYVAYHVGTSWNSARAMLLELVIEERIGGVRTSRGWIFLPKVLADAGRR
jgi:response regulator of citrate/malate metabolism